MKAAVQEMKQLRDELLLKKRNALKVGDKQQAKDANLQVKNLNKHLRIIRRDY